MDIIKSFDGNGASGNDLRYLAIEGKDKELRNRLKNIANTVSADELGLTPLHYAVWNGHVECVKLLLANNQGIDKEGCRSSSLLLQTNLGYTALHLAALDCPIWAIKEITFLLLLIYPTYTTPCGDGRTAIDIARECNNQPFIDVYNRFIHSNNSNNDSNNNNNNTNEEDSEFQSKKLYSMEQLKSSKYKFTMPEILPRLKTKFSLPSTIIDNESCNVSLTGKSYRVSKRLPPGMLMPEAEPSALVHYGDENMHGVQAFRCIKFALNQEEINLKRRLGLVQIFDKTIKELTIESTIPKKK